MASAAALIVLGLGVRQLFFVDAALPRVNYAGQGNTSTSTPPVVSRAEAVTRLSTQPEQQAMEKRAGEPQESLAAETYLVRGAAAPVVETVQQHELTERHIQRSTDSKSEDATAVIGRPFPVSTSVEATCRLLGGSCDEKLDGLLTEFAQQPRDPAWAPDMETTLRNHLTTAEPDKYTIRALECRTTLCAVEVASLYGAYHGAPYVFVRGNDLFNGSAMYGYESSQSMERVTVTLRTFERR